MNSKGLRQTFLEQGWVAFPPEPSVDEWCASVRSDALAKAQDPEERVRWLRHGGTWFAGVNALGADEAGRVGGGPPLQGQAMSYAKTLYGPAKLDPGQVSVIYPGYPKRDPSESNQAHNFRLRRDAAHVDGLLPTGAERRRKMQEPHAWILGIGLTAQDQGASPLVVWSGSHKIMQRAFAKALETRDPAEWHTLDMTETYHAARRACFETCPRVPLPSAPGATHLLHRLTLHGVAPWDDTAIAGPDGRAIVYFRPAAPQPPEGWLTLP